MIGFINKISLRTNEFKKDHFSASLQRLNSIKLYTICIMKMYDLSSIQFSHIGIMRLESFFQTKSFLLS